jgi:putative oxidoreductase
MREISRDIGLLVMRLGFGLLMLFGHGWPKLMMALGDAPIQFADPIGLGVTSSLYAAIFAEFLCSIFIIIGFKTRAAAIVLAFTMLVAAFIVHATDPFFSKKEFALVYALYYLGLACTGPGRFSLDHMLRR